MSIGSCVGSCWLGRAPHAECPVPEHPLLTPVKVKNCKKGLMLLGYPSLPGNEVFTADCKVNWMLRAPPANPLMPSAGLGPGPVTQLSPKTQPPFLWGTDRAGGKHQTSPAPHSTPSSAKGDASAPKPPRATLGSVHSDGCEYLGILHFSRPRRALEPPPSPLPLPALGICSLWCPPDRGFDLKALLCP